MTAAAALMMAALSGGPGCEAKDLMPALPQKVNERALLDAACGPECVVTCPKYDPDQAESPQQLFAHYEGAFRCPGRLESIVSLFPCHDAAGMHGVAGTLVLLRARKPPGKSSRGPRWEQVDTIEHGILNGTCEVVRVAERDVLVCLSAWGPYQGIMGQSLCVLGAAGQFEIDCPLSASDSCNAGLEDTFSAGIESWRVGPPQAGAIPVRASIKRAGCDGQGARLLEAVVLIDADGARLSPETVELLKKVDVGQQ